MIERFAAKLLPCSER